VTPHAIKSTVNAMPTKITSGVAADLKAQPSLYCFKSIHMGDNRLAHCNVWLLHHCSNSEERRNQAKLNSGERSYDGILLDCNESVDFKVLGLIVMAA
jgi:hypothetical protein